MCLPFKQSKIVGLQDFATVADLDAWYDLHSPSLPPPNLCDDYSSEAQRLAEMDGYYLSMCLVAEGRCYQTQLFYTSDGSPDVNFYHLGNMAKVVDKQELWYIDLNWRKIEKLCDLYKGGKW
jgi:hypothetical protein